VINKAIVVIGVVYPAATPYLNSYLESLEKQTFQNFDLILGNDGVTELEVYLQKYSLKTTVYPSSGLHIQNRIDLINIALKAGYEYIIFTDCDDYFSLNRVEESVNLLKNNHIVVNDLDILSDDLKIKQLSYFSNRIDDGKILKTKDILHYNMMGLTNVSVRREVLLKCVDSLKPDVVALDWILWSHALLNGFKAKFTNNTSTKYRVYSGNIAGLPQELNNLTITSGLSVKIMHYAGLRSFDAQYLKLFNDFSEAKKMSRDPSWLSDYIIALNQEKIEYPLWWENIKTPEQVKVL
jgi:glycosyltransferase involved in cell wall biosynthesis